MKKKSMVFILCVIMLLAACSAETEDKLPQNTQSIENKEEEPEKEYQAKLDAIDPSAYSNADGLALEAGTHISVIGRAQDSAFWKEVEKGANQAVADINEELNYEGNDQIKVTYNSPSESNNVDEQVNILDEELARYPIALAISIVDVQACEVQFDLATENGVPVVAFESGSDYKGLMAMVSMDNKKSAQEAAEKMAQKIGEKGKVIILSEDSGSATTLTREKAFSKAVKKNYEGIKVAEAYHINEMRKIIADEVNAGTYSLDEGEISKKEPSEGSVPEGEAQEEGLPEEERIEESVITQENIMDYILRKDPDIKGIFATSGNTAVSALEGIERQQIEGVAIIGYDMGGEERDALKEGKISDLVVQNPFGMGYASVIAAARSALELGNEADIDTGYIWINKDNLEDENVQKMLY